MQLNGYVLMSGVQSSNLTNWVRGPFNNYVDSRAVGRSENSGVPVLFGRHNLPPLVEIGLTDRSKIGGAMAIPGTPRDNRPA